MKPAPIDDNGRALITRASELFTTRIIASLGSGAPLNVPVDVKEMILHIESGTELVSVLGEAPGSIAARFTRDGSTLKLPIVAPAGVSVCALAAIGEQRNVSVFAWR